VAAETGATEVFINREVTPFGKARDEQVGRRIRLRKFEGNTVHPIGSVTTASGDPYRVFSAFYRSWSGRLVGPYDQGRGGATIADNPGSPLPSVDESPIIEGESAAQERLSRFLTRIDRYDIDRDFPGIDATSRLSIDLKYGWIGPRDVVAAAAGDSKGRKAFVRQLAWRDFYANVLDAIPDTVNREMRPNLRDIVWRDDSDGFAAWQSGQTGYPLVDAGMRQLRGEGWMHNRVRLVAASFLVKDLLIDWRRGERHFRRMLLDGDVAQNVGNWQWVAGTGTDASPYFRVFNPVTQSRRFDPDGTYIRHWVPELRDVPSALVHSPWTAGPLELAAHGVSLGENYPEPIVDHAMARERAMGAYRFGSGEA
jgi:deoxyribodipyrimidine photo-lyase